MKNTNTHPIRRFIFFVRNLIINPRVAFQSLTLKTNALAILLSVLLGGIFTLWKSFRMTTIKVNFFENERLNELLSVSNIPQVQWGMSYLGYFFFICVFALLCRIILKKPKIKLLVLGILSIGTIGLFVAVLVTVLIPLLPIVATSSIVLLVSFWVLGLTVLAVKFTQNISMKKAVLFFVVSAFPTFLLFGLPGLFPCFLWLSV